ncbi:MAG TPA: NAD(P)-dependent oxidoreductase [Gammaproteobacteria bacterium]|nr:NAD(P)-dependent oxidoreductase [Gammaproteobacteria bacterium]
MARIAFIGLGAMGYPMAGHLANEGHTVTVYNRTQATAEQWLKEYSGRLAQTPAQAALDAEFVMCCVGNDDDLRSVTLGVDGAFSAMPAGSVFIDHTTASAQVAKQLAAEAVQRGFAFLDAPVSGGQLGAQNGVLTIMVGGEAGVYQRAVPILQCYARMQRLMGEVGSGQLTKMVNQICVGGLLQGLAEALHFAQSAGLDADAAMQVISKGAAQSWQLDNRYKTMLAGEFDFGFAVEWMRKDYAIVLEEARCNGASLPVTALVDQFYADIEAMGGARWDTSSLIARLKTKS